MIFQKNELKLLWPFYLDVFISNIFFLIPPFFVIYFNSLGFSATQIGFLLASWPLASILFEIPTGAIADIYGRKFSVRLSYIFSGIFIFLIFFVSNYYLLLALLFLFGIAVTLSSGSYEAWMYDLLKKDKKLISHLFTKEVSISNLALVLSGILGSIVVAFLGLRYIWLFSGIAFIISFIILGFAKESFVKTKIGVYSQIKTSLSYSLVNKKLLLIFIISFIIAFASSFRGLISFTPFLKSFSFPDAYYGYLWSVMSLLGVFAPFLAQRLSNGNKEKKYLIIISIITLIYGFFILFVNNLYFLLAMILISSFIFDFRIPLSRIFFHRYIPSSIRATSGSTEGVITSLAGVISLPIAGILLDSIGPKLTIFIASLLMIPVIYLYLKIK